MAPIVIDFHPGRISYEKAISVPERARPAKLKEAIAAFETSRDAALDLQAERRKLEKQSRDHRPTEGTEGRMGLAAFDRGEKLAVAARNYQAATRDLQRATAGGAAS